MNPRVRRILLLAVPLATLAWALALRLFGTGGLAQRVTSAFQAEAAKNLPDLYGKPLARPEFVMQAEILLLAAFGLGVALLLARGKNIFALSVVVLGIAASAAASWSLAREGGLFFDPAFPSLALAATYALGILSYGALAARERARLTYSLAKHLAPDAMAQIVHRPELLKLNGETRNMTYLVCRIRGFASLADSFKDDPEGFSRLMRRVLTPLSQCVLDRRGAVDRVTPGGLSAFFNAPIDDPQHAVHACECALRMTQEMEKVNQALEQERRADGSLHMPIEIGIGINTGTGVAGDFGPLGRTEYTVSGAASLLAREIESLSGKYGPAIIVGEATRAEAERNFAFLEVDLIAGRDGEPTPIFALLGNPLVRASPKFRALHTFHEHIFQSYRAQSWEKTRSLIAQCRQLSGASPLLYDLYLARIEYLERHKPGENWNGVFKPAPL